MVFILNYDDYYPRAASFDIGQVFSVVCCRIVNKLSVKQNPCAVLRGRQLSRTILFVLLLLLLLLLLHAEHGSNSVADESSPVYPIRLGGAYFYLISILS